MGSLFEELEARENLERLQIARETVFQVMAEMSAASPSVPDAVVEEPAVTGNDGESSAYAGAERRVVGVLTVPNWRPGMDTSALPGIYRDIVEVVRDAPGPVRAQQIVPRIGCLRCGSRRSSDCAVS